MNYVLQITALEDTSELAFNKLAFAKHTNVYEFLDPDYFGNSNSIEILRF